MLSKKSLLRNHLAFCLCCKLHTLPIFFNRAEGTIDTYNSSRDFKWLLWLSLSLLHCIFITFRLIQAVLFHGCEFAIEQLPFHVICVCASMFNTYVGIAAFIKWPRVNMLLFNELYDFHEGTVEADRDHSVSKRPNSMQQLLIPLLPQMNFNCCLVILIIHLYKPHSLQFLYSVLPSSTQTPLTLALCVTLEVSVCFYWMGMAHYSSFVQLSFFEKTAETIKSRIQQWRHIESAPRCYRNIYLELRKIHLEMTLFNLSYAFIVFSWKSLNFIVPTFAIYFAIAWFDVHPILAGSNLFIGVYAFFLFVITYDRAFSIPLGTRTLVEHVNHVVKLRGTKAVRLLYSRRLKSLPPLGIKVGGFHYLERATTPKFVFFITNSVFNLLVLTR